MNLIIGIVGLLAVMGWTYLVYRRVDIGLISLLLGETYYIAFGLNATLLGGLHLTPPDLVVGTLLLAGIVRTVRISRTLNVDRVIILFCAAILFFSIARGLMDFGVTATGNEARAFTGLLAGLIYFATAPVDSEAIRRYVNCYLYFGFALCVIAGASAAGLPIGIMNWVGADLAAINGRYLPATGAAALAVCGFLSLAVLQYRKNSWVSRILPVMYLSLAIYLRHRTVWMMLLAGFAAMLIVDPRLFRRVLPFAGVAIAAVALIAIYGSDSRGIGGGAQFSDAMSNGQTFAWRVNGWKELLLDDEQNTLTVAVGKKMGSRFWRVDPVSYQIIDVAPHNEYIQDYLRIGVLGVLLVLALMLHIVRKLWLLAKYNQESIYPSASAWAIVVPALLVYGFTYSIPPHMYALLGIACSMTMGANWRELTTEDTSLQEWHDEELPDTYGEMA